MTEVSVHQQEPLMPDNSTPNLDLLTTLHLGKRSTTAHSIAQTVVCNMGNLNTFLGLKLLMANMEEFSQRKYALDLLKETKLFSCKPTSNPMDFHRLFGRDWITHGKHEAILSQKTYALDLLEETGLFGCMPMSNPIDFLRLSGGD